MAIKRGLRPPAMYAVVATTLRGVRAADPETAEDEAVRYHVKPGASRQAGRACHHREVCRPRRG